MLSLLSFCARLKTDHFTPFEVLDARTKVARLRALIWLCTFWNFVLANNSECCQNPVFFPCKSINTWISRFFLSFSCKNHISMFHQSVDLVFFLLLLKPVCMRGTNTQTVDLSIRYYYHLNEAALVESSIQYDSNHRIEKLFEHRFRCGRTRELNRELQTYGAHRNGGVMRRCPE